MKIQGSLVVYVVIRGDQEMVHVECWKELGQWDLAVLVCAEPTSYAHMTRFSFLNIYLVNLARKVNSSSSEIEMHKISISEPAYQIRQHCFSRSNYYAFSNMIERKLERRPLCFPFCTNVFHAEGLGSQEK